MGQWLLKGHVPERSCGRKSAFFFFFFFWGGGGGGLRAIMLSDAGVGIYASWKYATIAYVDCPLLV